MPNEEENLDDLDLDSVKTVSESLMCAISEKKENTLTLQNYN